MITVTVWCDRKAYIVANDQSTTADDIEAAKEFGHKFVFLDSAESDGQHCLAINKISAIDKRT